MLTEEDKLILQRYKDSIHIPTPAEERDTYIRAILTSTFYPYFQETPKEMGKAFSSIGLEPDTNKSYFVYGANKDILYKFAAFYIINGNRNFTMYFVKELTELLTNNNRNFNQDDAPLFKNDLLILYNHSHITAMGGQQDLYYSTVINRVVERNRRNLPTLVLSEIREPRYETCGELEFINLGVVLADKKYNPAPAAKVIQTKKSVAVSNPSTYSLPESSTTSCTYNKKKKGGNDYLNVLKERQN